MPFHRLFALCFLAFICHTSRAADKLSVVVAAESTNMEQYAAKELCRYIHAVFGELPGITNKNSSAGFILGRRGYHAIIDQLIKDDQLSITPTNPGPQGYQIKKLKINNNDVIVIAANDETGVLYGVYGF